jgi:hypothetical protein
MLYNLGYTRFGKYKFKKEKSLRASRRASGHPGMSEDKLMDCIILGLPVFGQGSNAFS